MRRTMLILFCFFASLATGSVNAKNNLLVEWQGGKIIYEDFKIAYSELVPLKMPKTISRNSEECAFGNAKTSCFRLNNKKTNLYYGHNLIFVTPIAKQPRFYIKPSPNEIDHSVDDDWIESAKNAKWIGSRKDYKAYEYKSSEISEILNVNGYLGVGSEFNGYFSAPDTLGGQYVLSIYKDLIGKVPSRKCDFEAPCSVVLSGSIGNKSVIAYCEIQNTAIGLSPPYECEIVAYKEADKWFISAYGSPEQCDGCGGASGISCTIYTDANIDDVSQSMISAMKREITNISLTEISRKKNQITLAGKKIASDSKFFSGYYEKVYAIYKISVDSSDPKQRFIEIGGLYNLLVSADPSLDSVNYRDIGTKMDKNGLMWFQDKVLGIIENKVAKKLNKDASCSNQGID